MRKILEIKENICNSSLLDNIYEVNKITHNLIRQINCVTEINIEDYNYLNIIIEKTKGVLTKAYEVLKRN